MTNQLFRGFFALVWLVLIQFEAHQTNGILAGPVPLGDKTKMIDLAWSRPALRILS